MSQTCTPRSTSSWVLIFCPSALLRSLFIQSLADRTIWVQGKLFALWIQKFRYYYEAGKCSHRFNHYSLSDISWCKKNVPKASNRGTLSLLLSFNGRARRLGKLFGSHLFFIKFVIKLFQLSKAFVLIRRKMCSLRVFWGLWSNCVQICDPHSYLFHFLVRVWSFFVRDRSMVWTSLEASWEGDWARYWSVKDRG